VIAQHNIQAFLKHYQQVRRVTILLTSHYMKDVVALCGRVVIIALGRIVYDGSLSGIIDRFGGHKLISLQLLNGERPAGLERYGELLAANRPGPEFVSSAPRCPRSSPTFWPTTAWWTSAWKTRRSRKLSRKCLDDKGGRMRDEG